MTGTVRASRGVDVPVERAWALLTDWDKQGRWIPLTRVRARDGNRVGGRIEAWTGIGPVGFLDTMRIIRWEPPRLCEVAHTGRVVRGAGLFQVDPVGAGSCRVTWEERLDLPLGAAGRMAFTVAKPLTRAGMSYVLGRFARLCAADS